jgi:hypothetical protein
MKWPFQFQGFRMEVLDIRHLILGGHYKFSTLAIWNIVGLASFIKQLAATET